MKKQSAAALALACSLAFSGCGGINFDLSGDVEKLLRAPQLSSRTADVQRSLNNYLGEVAQLKYPASGDFLTPFLFCDLDGNGREDAAVLYTCKAKGQNVCLAVLEERGGVWEVTQEVEGLSTEIEGVTLAAMDDSKANQILVGYSSAQGDRYLAVYAYKERTLETVLQQTYSQLLMADITGAGSDDLVIVTPEEEQEGIRVALLTNIEGSFRKTQELRVGPDSYTGCASLYAGQGNNGQPYLVVDGKMGGYLSSSILIYDSHTGQLQDYIPAGFVDFSAVTLRYNNALHSRDVNGDGTVDIPWENNSSASIMPDVSHRLSVVEWYDYIGGGQGNCHFSVLDGEYDFCLFLPQDWRNAIQLTANETGDGWTVRRLDRGDVLLDVRVMDVDTAIPDGYNRIAMLGRQQVRVRLYTDPHVLSLQQIQDRLLIL